MKRQFPENEVVTKSTDFQEKVFDLVATDARSIFISDTKCPFKLAIFLLPKAKRLKMGLF